MSPAVKYMQGSDYDGRDVTGWIATEKYDGFFARWTGSKLLTREGNDLNAPEWFTRGLPPYALDCELFAGYGQRAAKLNNIESAKDDSRWHGLKLVVFDAPSRGGDYGSMMRTLFESIGPDIYVTVAPCLGLIKNSEDLWNKLLDVQSHGGEGLMIRKPNCAYIIGRTYLLLKVKNYHP